MPDEAEKVENTTAKKFWPWIIILAVLMIGAMGVGIYSFVKMTQRGVEVSDLKNQLVEKEADIEDLKQKMVEDAVTESVGAGPYIKDGYFYVPEWGVKYQLMDGLTDYGYAVMQDSLSNSFGKYVIGMSAVGEDDLIVNPQVRYYDDIFTCAMVTVTRMDQDLSNVVGPRKIIQEDGMQYVVYDYKASNSCDFEDKAGRAVEKLVEMFSHPEGI